MPRPAHAATYYSSGTTVSANLLEGLGVSTIDEFGYNASSIPANTSIQVQFSQDAGTWYDASGNAGQWETLSQGDFTASGDGIDLSVLNWKSAYFYYQVQFDTTDTAATALLDDVIVYYTAGTSVSTSTTSEVAPDSAAGNGEITALYGGNATTRGFEYGLTETATWEVHEDGDFGAETYSLAITGLDALTTYYIRSYATNPESTGYGDWVSFTTGAYETTGTLTSTNLLSGESAESIQRFAYTLSAKPANTTASIQFSKDGSTWFDSSGVRDGTDTLSSGVNSVGLCRLAWSGSNFYYKLTFTSSATDETPVLDDVNVGADDANDICEPVAYNFDEGTGTIAHDSGGNRIDADISGATWQGEEQCVFGKCLQFDGSNDTVTAQSTVSNIQTVEFWVKPITSTESLISFDGTGHYVSATSGALSADGFGAPTIYVNGNASSPTLAANTWQHVAVTTSTAFSGSSVVLGQVDTNYFEGFIDEVKIYPYARSADEIKADYNSRGSVKGTAARFGPGNEWMSDGLVGYWKMDFNGSGDGVTVPDSSGNSNNGTTENGANGTGMDCTGGGKFGYGCDFDGSDDYVSVGSNYDSIATNNQITVSTWVKISDLTKDQRITSRFNTEQQFVLWMDTGGTGDGYGFEVKHNSDTDYKIVGENTSTAIANTWQYVVGTYDGKTVKVYVDGELKDSASYDNTLNASSVPIQIGYLDLPSGQTDQYYDGLIDDVRIYNRALSAAEVQKLYKWAPGPVGWWKMDDGVSGDAQTIVDSSGNGYNGTTNGTNVDCKVQGKFGKGCKFDGTNEDITISDNSDFDITGAATLSYWINNDPVPTISLVGNQKSGSATNGNNVTLTFDGTPQKGDVVLLIGGHSDTTSGGSAGPVTSGYTQIVRHTSANMDFGAWYKVLGDTPDTSVTGRGEGSAQFVAVYLAYVLRGVDTSSIIDVTPTEDGEYSWTTPNNPAITTVSDNAWVIPVIGMTLEDNTPSAAPSGYSKLAASGATDTVRFTAAAAKKQVDTAGTEDPGNWSWSDPKVWYGITIAIKPAEAVSAGKGKDTYSLNIEDGYNLTGYINTSETVTAQISSGWHHVAMSYDGNIQKLYVDGIPESSNSFSSSIGTNNNDLVIGNQLPGTIDDVRIYNYARTQEQILEDMNAGHPAIGTPVGSGVLDLSFDEGYGSTAHDKSPSANNGTLGSGSSAPTWTNDGKFGKALSFDGTNDYVSYPMNLPTSEGTISHWVKADQIKSMVAVYESNGASSSYNGFGDSTSIQEVHTGINDSGEYVIYYQDGDDGSPDGQAFVTGGTVAVGEWAHLVATWNRNGNLTLYVNGMLIGTDDMSGLTFADITPTVMRIGQPGYTTASRGWDGLIDQVQIYPFAVSADQVKLLYNQGKQTVLGSLSQNTSGTGLNSSSSSYCPPGDSDSCVAPVLEMNMDEKTGQYAYDTSSNGNNGTLGSGATADSADPTWVVGKVNNALSFDGSDDYVSVTQNSTINDLNTFTISMWFYGDSAGDSNNGRFIDKQDSLTLYWNNVSQLIFSAKRWDTMGTWIYDNSSSMANAWHNVAISYDYGSTSNDPVFYIDGQVKTITESSTPAGSLSSETSNIIVGDNASLIRSFDGRIDQVKIYNYARTPAQIAWDYNKGAPVAWYKFDECSGAVANDAIGDNDGTINYGTLGNTSVGTCNSGTSTEMWDNGTTGKWGASLDFDGSDDYVSLSNPSAYNFSNSAGVSLWVKSTSDTPQTLFSLTESTTNNNYQTFYLGNPTTVSCTNELITLARRSNSTDSYVLCYETSNRSQILDGNWHHLFFTFNGSTVRFYLDGVEINLTTGAGSNDGTYGINTINDASIASRIVSSSRGAYLNGQIDDVRIYNYALTDEQVKEIYNNGAVNFQ